VPTFVRIGEKLYTRSSDLTRNLTTDIQTDISHLYYMYKLGWLQAAVDLKISRIYRARQ